MEHQAGEKPQQAGPHVTEWHPTSDPHVTGPDAGGHGQGKKSSSKTSGEDVLSLNSVDVCEWGLPYLQ